jgi:hypothetical protein
MHGQKVVCVHDVSAFGVTAPVLQFAYSSDQTTPALNRDPDTAFALRGEAKPEELSFRGPRHCAFGQVDLQVQGLLEKDPDAAHHPFARHLTAHINVAVVGVSAKCQTARFQLPVQVGE